ncbi:hypothetical protein HMPREF9374_1576 [Desmospora sp. 8437]|nr:hypothetical protein HMPREF9374_1576 [Desmospora sp. 8437]
MSEIKQSESSQGELRGRSYKNAAGWCHMLPFRRQGEEDYFLKRKNGG